MSADAYEDCPICNGIRSVRIDNLREYELNADKTITVAITGYCRNCGAVFSTSKTDNEAGSRT